MAADGSGSTSYLRVSHGRKEGDKLGWERIGVTRIQARSRSIQSRLTRRLRRRRRISAAVDYKRKDGFKPRDPSFLSFPCLSLPWTCILYNSHSYPKLASMFNRWLHYILTCPTPFLSFIFTLTVPSAKSTSTLSSCINHVHG